MDKTNNRLLIHQDMEHVTLEQSVEIILTPHFYTFIREELDINFSYQAKQIAASLFDDYVNNLTDYQYHVSKCNNNWCFYAYNIEEIEKFLEGVGIEKHRVSKIYFAQELSSVLDKPIQISDKNVLKTIDDTVTIIPLRFMEEDTEFKTLNLAQVKLNSGVSLGAAHSSFIPLKETIILSSIFFILGTIFILEGNRIKASISNENEQLVELIDENPKYGSTLLRTNILETYEPIDKNERAKRQNIKDIAKLLSANSQLTALNIRKSTIKANIKTSNSTISKQVIQSAKAKEFKSSNSGSEIQVEKKL
ncbi:MAG: Unknown protein [uncultured Sulfurovum sp.]|uniref:Uncharacterized protein n=1 Tax=uncultured Sulfurovum sp. TaxID=269237 RepID=A0A6S6TXX4_9BACT|nr:MAG: Unknown protein [uncultured Sulfurovum sp.]